MTGNDQKSAWEHHLGVGTINFCDLGCPGMYSGVLEGDFHVDSHNPKVGHGGENFKNFRKVSKVTKVHVMTGNDQQSVWDHHLGVGTMIVGPRRV